MSQSSSMGVWQSLSEISVYIVIVSFHERRSLFVCYLHASTGGSCSPLHCILCGASMMSHKEHFVQLYLKNLCLQPLLSAWSPGRNISTGVLYRMIFWMGFVMIGFDALPKSTWHEWNSSSRSILAFRNFFCRTGASWCHCEGLIPGMDLGTSVLV